METENLPHHHSSTKGLLFFGVLKKSKSVVFWGVPFLSLFIRITLTEKNMKWKSCRQFCRPFEFSSFYFPLLLFELDSLSTRWLWNLGRKWTTRDFPHLYQFPNWAHYFKVNHTYSIPNHSKPQTLYPTPIIFSLWVFWHFLTMPVQRETYVPEDFLEGPESMFNKVSAAIPYFTT